VTRTRLTTTAAAVASTAGLTLIPTWAWAAPGDEDIVKGPNIRAGARNAPGAQAINDLIDTIGFYGIIGCLGGLLLSGLILVIGPRLGFDRASTVGKIGIFASLGGAFLIGISATLINFFYNAGA
jgi:hypothetical protein